MANVDELALKLQNEKKSILIDLFNNLTEVGTFEPSPTRRVQLYKMELERTISEYDKLVIDYDFTIGGQADQPKKPF